ncbi:MAG: hypothetical protein HY529_03270 [Chloroflexi bacterium]|nr:hypothetical protein [Chloroflexota bacterium]
MSQLNLAIRVVEIIIAVLLVLLVGDYLGYKIGRRRLALIVATIALVTVVIFAIYAAVVLA